MAEENKKEIAQSEDKALIEIDKDTITNYCSILIEDRKRTFYSKLKALESQPEPQPKPAAVDDDDDFIYADVDLDSFNLDAPHLCKLARSVQYWAMKCRNKNHPVGKYIDKI